MSEAAASLLREKLPLLDPTLSVYLSGYLTDAFTVQTLQEDNGAELQSFLVPAFADFDETIPTHEADQIIAEIAGLLVASGSGAQFNDPREARQLDRVVDLKALGKLQSASMPLNAAVDISSTTKARTTQVDLKKLEKAEEKLKVKANKRAKKTGLELYEGSKLLDAKKRQEEYEEMFMQVNPLSAFSNANKGKSKDVHLENIDLSFGSLRILSSAALTIAGGRRYGLIGRNGIGKSTLLKHMAVRDLAIPPHISVLYVDQEAHGDDVSALQTVLNADVWREKLLKDERELNEQLASSGVDEKRKEKLSEQLGEVHQSLLDIDAETGPSRAAELLFGLGFDSEDQQKATRTFSGGWRFRISLARALFVKPDLLLLDEPSNNLDLVALAWLEDYLANSWTGSLLVVSHDRSFLDAVATDIIHMHSQRLDYYKGNFAQFYATKGEREKNQRKEYEAQQLYRAGLQAFIDRWRYNANRAAQAQSKIKVLEKLPVLEPPQDEMAVSFTFQEADKLSPPLLQLTNATFSYEKGSKNILEGVDLDVGLESRIGLIGPNGAGKSTLLKLLIGENEPSGGQVNRNGRLRIAYFAQHQVDALDLTLSPVGYLAKMFPGQSEQEYRTQLGHFGITGLTGLQLMSTLSGGQKSRVAFACLSLLKPHLLILDEPTNHIDMESHDALSKALNRFTGGVLVVSHDQTFIENVCKELWMVQDGHCKKHYGSVEDYKNLILKNSKAVLLFGGYLVLDKTYFGIVAATQSRFYTLLRPLNHAPRDEGFELSIISPQFTNAAAQYKLQIDNCLNGWTLLKEAPYNPFLDEAVLAAANVASALYGLEHVQKAARHGCELYIIGDNEFYSQETAEKLSTQDDLIKRLNIPISKVHKTGLGSSAAMVTSLLAGLLHFFTPSTHQSHQLDRSLIHNLAQYVHSVAQGKIGSGFDVSAAVYGSHIYERFDPACFQRLLDDFRPANQPDHIISPQRLLDTLSPARNSLWASKGASVHPFSIPPLTTLMLADVDAGSHTPTMVGKVLKWRASKPEEANPMWQTIGQMNQSIYQAFLDLSKAYSTNSEEYSNVVDRLAKSTSTLWSAHSELEKVFKVLAEDMANVRIKMKHMGDLASVEIEPDAQTRVLDACSAIPGVIGAGVPGAGGWDAAWILVVCPPSDKDMVCSQVEALWAQWKEMHISCLSKQVWDRAQIDASGTNQGLSVQRVKDVPLLHRSLQAWEL